MTQIRIGVMQPVALPVENEVVFDLANDIGFDGVELGWQKPQQIEKGGIFDASNRYHLLNRVERVGIAVPSIVASFVRKGLLFDPDTSVQNRTLNQLIAGIELCECFQAGVLLLPFFGQGDLGHRENAKLVTKHLRALAQEAERANVILGIETSLPADALQRLIGEVNSPNVRVYWDMGNSVSLGYDPFRELKLLYPHIVQVHVKEFMGVPSNESPGSAEGINSVPLGKGLVPLQSVVETLVDAGYQGWYVLETGIFGEHPHAVVDSARAALNVLRSISAQINN